MGLRLSKESRKVEMATYASLRHSSDNSNAEQIAKRAFDVFVASCILLFTAPLILTIALFIRLQDGGPAIFKQMRQGKNGTPFPCYKLRSTSLGQFIRKSSIDELPQLLNVIRGDMSLVGPRPIVESEISKYGEHYKHYCAVRPGLTGLWQVRGRSDTSYETRVAMDVEYARTRTFLTDVKILLLTVPAVVNSKGAR